MVSISNLRFAFSFLVLFSLVSFVFSACYVNGVEVECPQFLDDYGLVIGIIVAVIILIVIVFAAFIFLKSFLTGNVTIDLPKTVFAPNEKIIGKMGINLKKAVELSNAKVMLQGEVTKTQFRNGSKYSKIEIVFQTSQNVVISPNYPIGKSEVEFSINVPDDILKKGKFDASSLGQLGNAINFIQSVALPKPRWYLIALITTKENLTLSTKKEIQIN